MLAGVTIVPHVYLLGIVNALFMDKSLDSTCQELKMSVYGISGKRKIATIIKIQGDLGLIYMQLEQLYIMH